MRKRKKAFTLMELLVVIAIIALLMSIMMPSLAKVKMMAKDVVCLSQLKQWSLAIFTKVSDNNGKMWEEFQLGAGTGTPTESVCRDSVWYNVLDPYMDENEGILLCPTTSITKPWGRDGVWAVHPTLHLHLLYEPQRTTHLYGSYGWNNWVARLNQYNTFPHLTAPDPHSMYAYQSLDSVLNADRVPIMGDSWYLNGWCYDNDIPPDFEILDASAIKNNHEYSLRRHSVNRHRGQKMANFVFVDGSVGPVMMRELWELRWHKQWQERAQVWPEWMKDK